jgi:polysaccharide export outer membrane protein
MRRFLLASFTSLTLCASAFAQDAKPSNDASRDAAVTIDAKAPTSADTQSPSSGNAPVISAIPAIKISSGDMVNIKVFGVPEMESEGRVNDEGLITVALVGPVNISGMTSREAEKTIAGKLVEAGMLKNPQVSVLVKEYVTQGISVMGEVAKPGIYPLLGARRLFDVLSFAGGTTDKAGRIVSITRRNDPDHPVLVSLNSDPSKSSIANVDVQPGDTVVVSKAGVVYVVGDVMRPGGFIMDNNESLRVLQAIALAQGFNRTAKLDAAKLIRKTPDGPKEIAVPLQKIMESKVADVEMQNDDILFVPTSAAKGIMRRSMEAAIQAATGVAIYRR